MGRIKKVGRLVRSGEIRQIEAEGNIANYETLKPIMYDIFGKTELGLRYIQALNDLLIYKINKYLRCKDEDKAKEQKAKLDLLVDIEEIIFNLARVNTTEIKLLVNHAQTFDMEMFKQSARIGKPTLLGCAREFITFGEIEDLIYAETALMQELHKINPDKDFYAKFERMRTGKKNNLGGYKNGNILHSIEYVNKKEEGHT